MPALIVNCQEARFAIPQDKLVELVRIEQNGNDSVHGLESLQGRPVYRLRGDLLPLIHLREVLDPSFVYSSEMESEKDSSSGGNVTNIAVLNADSRMFGLIVDEIEDSADIVVKPLIQFLKILLGPFCPNYKFSAR